ncbi:MAG: glycine--tRNA ligase subunit beta [Acidobacteria bacterium]|nr:glycine--tRNA ligase subunit beta [Acidobacteriota bacterium]MCB9378955.1 glycine--tRNA ligase subunit beta [Holophagales bacterium]
MAETREVGEVGEVAEATAGTSEFLLEVRLEEVPARMLRGAAQEIATRVFEELMRCGVAPGVVDSGFTPRRLWLTLRELPAKERDREVVEVGPPASAAFGADGTPTPAAHGFAKKLGVEVTELRRRTFSKGETSFVDEVDGRKIARTVEARFDGERVWVAKQHAGRSAAEILAELVPRVLAGVNWAKTMRWGSGTGPWVRPVHGIVALLDGEVVPFELFGVAAGRTTCGHPTLSASLFEVSGADDYLGQLVMRGILPSPDDRKEALRDEMAARAEAAGGRLVEDEPLLDKLAAICEIPGVMEGSFAEELTELPREVLTASLRDHQSALTVEREGGLAPIFLTVMDRPDDPAGRVRAGNEWVVAARLADARFFWEKDRSAPLAEKGAALDSLAFQERLGSYAEKAERLAALACAIAEASGRGAHKGAAERAARLAKIDLATEMVREFTSLQGVMGGLYARADGEPEAVWQAVYDQYLPAGADDELPRGDAGRAVALADRLDTLAGFFGLGPKLWPSGSKDPFGLRRAALGVVRLCLEGDDLDLVPLLERAAAAYPESVRPHWSEAFRATEGADGRRVDGPLVDFLLDRLDYLLGREGLQHDEIAAALGARGAGLRFGAIAARARAVRAVREEKEFLAVALSARRIANILKEEPAGEVVSKAFTEEAERTLDVAAGAFRRAVAAALATSDFEAGLRAVQALAAPLDRFFVDVLVMDPDPEVRRNRLALLAGIRREISRLADLSALIVEKAEYR